MFKANDILKSAVDEKDAKKVKAAIMRYILSNRYDAGNEVEDAVQYALDHGVSLFESNDANAEVDTNSANWDNEYVARASNVLYWNFSKEHFDHWLKVAKEVGRKYDAEHPAQPATGNAARPNVQASGPEKNADSHSAKINPVWIAGVAAAVVVTAVIIVAIVKWIQL